MYYDPKTKAQREWQIFEHQKMDFMMIVSPSQRIVFEISGIQHYAEDEIALGPIQALCFTSKVRRNDEGTEYSGCC